MQDRFPLLLGFDQLNLRFLYPFCILFSEDYWHDVCSSRSQFGHSSVGRACDTRFMQQSDGPWFDSGRRCFQLKSTFGRFHPSDVLLVYSKLFGSNRRSKHGYPDCQNRNSIPVATACQRAALACRWELLALAVEPVFDRATEVERADLHAWMKYDLNEEFRVATGCSGTEGPCLSGTLSQP